MGFGPVSLHRKGALADESRTPGVGHPWEGQSVQGQQGPKVSVHPNTEDKRARFVEVYLSSSQRIWKPRDFT